jgi:RES domain
MTDRPYPPPDIDTRHPRVATIKSGTFHRFYSRGQNPIFFDRSIRGRLNSPDGSFGVLYAAEQTNGAFAETFLRSPGRRLLPDDLIKRKALVVLHSTRPLQLVELHGPGLSILGATAEVTASPPPYDLPQAWSAALHNHPGTFDGIAYRARHDNSEICYALFDRSRTAIVVVQRNNNLDADWFYSLLRYYSVGIAPIA